MFAQLQLASHYSKNPSSLTWLPLDQVNITDRGDHVVPVDDDDSGEPVGYYVNSRFGRPHYIQEYHFYILL